jgi:iron complex transport system substrate-binding protein
VENATEEIKARKGWENINAIKENQVFLINANA